MLYKNKAKCMLSIKLQYRDSKKVLKKPCLRELAYQGKQSKFLGSFQTFLPKFKPNLTCFLKNAYKKYRLKFRAQ